MTMELRKTIDIACAREKAQLVLKNCKIVCVFTGDIIEGDIAVENGYIAGVGTYEGSKELDMKGMYVSPGLIDSHVHIDKPIDGHSPGLTGNALSAYAAAGVRTDHECSSTDEMRERLRLGMYVHIREGSAARNLEALLEGVTLRNSSRCTFCTDDKHPHELLEEGHIDSIIRKAVKRGLDVVDAIRMATINPALCYGLKNTGAIAPGYKADMVVFADLKDFRPNMVFKDGRLAARDGVPLFEVKPGTSECMKARMDIKAFTPEDMQRRLDNLLGRKGD
ncbi:amidohydrolase family protein [Peptoclostridium sp.]|uniref:amidohydrolase family protein n=1 Tax=Peptoclostridium sp. TaxID=1904860 RepID=UPI002ED6449B